jgi:hypothetical protein
MSTPGRLAASVVLLLALTGCTGTPDPPDRSGLLQPPGTMPWESALLLPGDPTLVTVSFVAGPEGPPSNPCADRFEIDADEAGDTVTLTVRELPPVSPPSDPAFACSLGGNRRYATADLDRPLGGRTLIDGSRDEDRPLTDASRDPARAAVRPVAGGRDALLAGSLGIDRASGCLWVENPAGRTPVLLAHPRYSVRLDATPAVLDEDNVPSLAGKQVRLGGGFVSRSDAVPGCPVSGEPFVGVLAR